MKGGRESESFLNLSCKVNGPPDKPNPRWDDALPCLYSCKTNKYKEKQQKATLNTRHKKPDFKV
ncbi:hypothetical protein SADUNF_Sadunf07G0045800 [Salix dunnii]|uniref:Uncharacterized protein n=1 Tax=Salix dunnii TaxID=1413687 RepID=A0A835MVP0_9ROSI|nr:hypothetical protein SADUNF_Sadunf07G0045800 [Salix dunnii]